MSSSVSADVYTIDATSTLLPRWSHFSITFNDSNPEDGVLRLEEIVNFSGVGFFNEVTGELWGPSDQVVQMPHTFLGGLLFIAATSIDNSWAFYDPDWYPPTGHTMYASDGTWTFDTVDLGPPIPVDFDIDFDVDGNDLVSYISDPSGIILEDFAAEFGINESQ